MNYLRNTISKLYEFVSTPVAATRDALAERLQSVRDTVTLLYNRTKQKLGYGGEKLKDIVEDEAEKQHEEQEEQEEQENIDLTPQEHEQAFKGAYRSFQSPGLPKTDVDTYIEKITPYMKALIDQQIRDMSSAKAQLCMWIKWKREEFEQANYFPGEVHEIIVEKAFNSKMVEIFQGSNIDEILGKMFAYIKTQIENPALPKSAFTLDSIMHLDISFYELQLTRGSTYINLPPWIANKKAVINPQNHKDDECFKWGVIASLHHEEIDFHPERISKLKPYSDLYNWKGMQFPVTINQIEKFEKNNPSIAVNVLYFYSPKEGKSKFKIAILRRSDGNASRSKVANLLLITDGEMSHYTAIKSLSRLLTRENSKHKGEYYFCINCLQAFHTEKSRDTHYTNCIDHDFVKVELPHREEDKYVHYHDGQKQFKVPFIMYADFESILEPMEKNSKGIVNKHTPSGWCVYSKFAYGDVPDPLKAYRGKDCVERFIDYIEMKVKSLYSLYPEKPMVPLTEVMQNEYEEASSCHICMKPFDNWKVRDHCYYTGLYRGAAHTNCNLKFKIPKHIPIVFHNLSGYDAHLFIRQLGEKFQTDDIGVIAENMETYISFNVKIDVQIESKPVKIELRFIDSFRFMASSLDSLARNLTDEECKNLRWFYKEKDAFKLMRRKGVYPYEYMDNWEKFEEVKLPDKEAFYSKLNMTGISDKDYEHAQQVWNSMIEKTLGSYHDVYLNTDVLLLADIFENFRDTCLKHYNLDPAHFYTAPGLAWVAALKFTKIKLELLTDYDMLLMFEKGIRGGITQAVHRYAKANNKHMGNLYKPEEESSYLQYLDANNLYGWAMSQDLPTGGFKWEKDIERYTTEKIANLVKRNARKGYLLEVDVEYPTELHDTHNDLPFMPEKMKINKVEKLIPNLHNKEKYVVHFRKLNQDLKHGLVLKKVHRVISYRQSAWLKEYIDKNTKLRKESNSDFEKDFFKLMNNSVFGKTMENKRKHKDMRLVTDEDRYKKLIMKPNFKNARKFSNNLMGVEMGKSKIKMTKPLYLGQAILDLSKMVMYEFHYDYMLPKYSKDSLQLCYMDTDSFVYHIKTKDFYEDISNDVEARFDTSNYSKEDNRPLTIGLNKKKIGLMKDELGGKIMTEFVALRAKLYAYKTLDKKEDKKCKGIKKCVVKKTLTFNDYKKCLDDGKNVYKSQMLFQNKDHEIYTSEINKIALNRDDDKRLVEVDQISTLARGHYKL